MKHIVMLVGAAALAFAGPAFAKPGKGRGHGQGNAHAQAHHGQHNAVGYGVGGCPPGLAKKAMPCMPPGQAKKLFNVGQQVPYGYQQMLGYNGLPTDLRNHYGRQLDPGSRYIYDNSYLYRVDPKTMVVQQVLNAILRPY